MSMGFTNPLALTFAGLYLVLVALYLWERHRRSVDVPSLLLWQTIPDAVVRTSRFRPDLLFVLQALLLGLLVAGFARPHWSARSSTLAPGRNIFVLDVSASMQAEEAGGTRFAQARRDLRDRISRLPEGAEMMIIAAGDAPWVAADLSTDRSAVLRHLDELEPTDCGADLNVAVALARRAAERADLPARIEVFTDLPPSRISPAWQGEVSVHQVGETDDNLAIEGLQVFQGRFQDFREARAQVAVRNHSHREAHGFLNVQVEDETVTRRGFSLGPGSLRGFPVEQLPRPGVLHVELEVDDALAADNHAWGWIRPVGPLRVLVVSDRPRLAADLASIARATPNLEFHLVSPDEYAGGALPAADIVLLHRYADTKPPRAATIYVAPARRGALFDVEGEAAQVPILDWNAEHPALRGLSPHLAFPLRHARILSLAPSMESLLTGRADGRDLPLVFAGEAEGHRVAGLAFDLVEERLLRADNVDLLLLFLNLLDWLAPSDPAVALVRTGSVEVIELPPELAPLVVDPHGRTWTVPRGEPVSIETRWAGEYRVFANGSSRRVLASLIDPVESDIGRTAERVSLSTRMVGGSVARGDGSHFGAWMYAAAAALFFLEWMVARRRA